jgi:hypothetical protein
LDAMQEILLRPFFSFTLSGHRRKAEAEVVRSYPVVPRVGLS